MKKLTMFPAFLGSLLLIAAFMVSCSSADEISQPTTTTTTPIFMIAPTVTEISATQEPDVKTTLELPAPSESTDESDDYVTTTDVVSVVIVAAEAALYGGPGEDYPVIGTALFGSNYPVTGISKDGLSWRLTCHDDAVVLIHECWILIDSSVAIPTESVAMSSGSEIKPYIELTFNFLEAVQSGLTAAGSEEYLSRDLQTIVEAGRLLPTLFGVRDAFPSFVITDFSDPRVIGTAQVRVRFNYDSPSYAVVTLIQEESEWRIDKVAAHNLVKAFGTGELMQAESVIIAYYGALANDEPEAAYDLLATETQESTSPQALSSIAEGLKKLTVSTLQPVRSTADQIVYYVRLLAVPDGSASAIRLRDWYDGENARWLTLVQNRDGWRIAQIINSPILSEITSWQRINVLPINMTLDIPGDWTRAGLQWAWSPNSLGMPGVGVSWAELDEFGGDETLLPRYRREESARPVDLGWARGTQYTFELMGGPGEAPIAAESHMIVQTGRRAYDFYATASEIEDLDDMQLILQRMVAAVSISDPQASAFNSVETSINFMATLLRDATGASSLPYLSEELRTTASDRSSLLSLLSADTLFQSFNASWLENPGTGQARVGVTMYFAGTEKELIFTVQRDSSDSWLITDIEPVDQ